LPELNNRPSCEGGKHGYRAPASIQFVPELKVGIIESLDSSKRVFGACEACRVHRRIMLLYNGAQALALPEMTMFAETLVWTWEITADNFFSFSLSFYMICFIRYSVIYSEHKYLAVILSPGVFSVLSVQRLQDGEARAKRQ
jgi:hypothetical protein